MTFKTAEPVSSILCSASYYETVKSFCGYYQMKWANLPWELPTLTRCLQPATPQTKQEQHMQCLLCYYGDGFSHPLCSWAYSSYQLLSRLVLHQERLRKESGRHRAELLPALDFINCKHSVQPSLLAAAWACCYCLKLPYSASSVGIPDSQ